MQKAMVGFGKARSYYINKPNVSVYPLNVPSSTFNLFNRNVFKLLWRELSQNCKFINFKHRWKPNPRAHPTKGSRVSSRKQYLLGHGSSGLNVLQKGTMVAAMAVLVMIIWAQYAGHVHSSADDCAMVSSVLESCYIALQSGTFFMKAERVCCRSLENLETRIWDHQLTRYAICECFKASDNDKQVLLNENLLEVQALCGPHVPHPITSYSDCVQYADERKNIAIAAL